MPYFLWFPLHLRDFLCQIIMFKYFAFMFLGEENHILDNKTSNIISEKYKSLPRFKTYLYTIPRLLYGSALHAASYVLFSSLNRDISLSCTNPEDILKPLKDYLSFLIVFRNYGFIPCTSVS